MSSTQLKTLPIIDTHTRTHIHRYKLEMHCIVSGGVKVWWRGKGNYAT